VQLRVRAVRGGGGPWADTWSAMT